MGKHRKRRSPVRKHKKIPPPVPHNRDLIKAYFALLGLLILISGVFRIPLFTAGSATVWLRAILFVIYALPLGVALAAGWRRTPFGKNFVSVFLGIYVIHAAFSIAVFFLRWDYQRKWQQNITDSYRQPLEKEYFHYFQNDQDNDGYADQLTFVAEFLTAPLPPGEYVVSLRLAPAGNPGAGRYAGVSMFQAIDERSEPAQMIVTIDPFAYQDILKGQPVDIFLDVRKHLHVDAYGRIILALSRWMPFFRTTSWEGYDPQIHEEVLYLRQNRIHTFTLNWDEFRHPQIVVKGYPGDYGVDTDGNGKYEYLVIPLKVDARYVGPLYWQFQVGGEDEIFYDQTRIEEGQDQVAVNIPGRIFRALGRDGSYDIVNFAMINNDPKCLTGSCPLSNQPFFSQYLPDYRTAVYTRQQFEAVESPPAQSAGAAGTTKYKPPNEHD